MPIERAMANTVGEKYERCVVISRIHPHVIYVQPQCYPDRKPSSVEYVKRKEESKVCFV